MSADNWAMCPKCKELADHKLEVLEDKVSKAYGQVSSEEYLALVKKIEQPIKLEQTLREDYEIGILDEEFYVRYAGACTVCGFRYEYKHDEKLVV